MAVKTSWAAGDVLTAADLTDTFANKSGYVVQATAPTGAAGLVWYDSSTTPPTPKWWDTVGSAWRIFSGARATYGSSTGSPSISTVSGKTVVKFTGSGTLTAATAGVCQVLCVGAGGGGGGNGSAGGGGGGSVFLREIYVPASTSMTVTVGAQGAAGGSSAPSYGGTGNYSSMYGVLAPGGGGGAGDSSTPRYGVGGSSGGGGSTNSSGLGGAALYGAEHGYAGSPGQGSGMGGAGGGAGGAASGGTPGAGVTLSITGSSVEYGKGGGPYTYGYAGPANTGQGGGGTTAAGAAGYAGGSGIVVVVFG